jgi:hypothetical protein
VGALLLVFLVFTDLDFTIVAMKNIHLPATQKIV